MRESLLLALFLLSSTVVVASETNQFLGAQSCASSSCHGGADTKSNQNLIWSQHDPHSKSFATLITARSERIAESLNITNAAKSSRCTVCHAPFATVPAELAATILDPAEGVSCESCHGMAKTWLRSHTRKDFAHADKVASGMRELRNLSDRANACVACHQNVDADLLTAGHPELIFELDGQSVSEHKHWQEQTNWSGAQAWFIGQLVAAREINFDAAKTQNPKQQERAAALNWLLSQTFEPLGPNLPAFRKFIFSSKTINYFESWNAIAKEAAEVKWTAKETRDCLVRLAQTSKDFRDAKLAQPVQARRAERLVLALDRLLLATKWKNQKASAELDNLFKLAQSLPDFDPAQFATKLDDFAQLISADTQPASH
ncbi:MAG: hypothetical protein JWO95_2475 [Verrucomicrobiales bacterium]|nr:hypothetical protein [Verrucomicrobiales bacterium]